MTMVSKKRLQKITRDIRDAYGVEMTPDQVDKTLISAYNDIRKILLSRGHILPEDDNDELLKIIKEVFEEGRSE